MANYNSSSTTAAQSTNGIFDYSGAPVISSGNSFGDSPLGIAARSQALYGIANAQFNLLPNDVQAELANSENPLPYWSVDNYSNGRIVPKSFFDTTTGTWSVELNPTAGSAADYLELKTRSYLLSDDNLALRQKAYLTMSKGTAYAGSTQFNVVLSAEYFDVNGTSLSSYSIGTALDNTAMTSISGVTTSGSAAIGAAAAYVDFTIKLDVTATVTSGVKVYLKSFIIQTSSAATGSFVIAETFTSSGTFTVPTGVNYVTVVGIGAGQGGQGAPYRVSTATSGNTGGAGGATGYYAILRDIYVGDVATVSVGIGAGGAGGTADAAISKPAGSATPTDFRRDAVTTGANGGDTTFGTHFTIAGARTAPSGFFGLESAAGAAGGTIGAATGGAGGTGGTHTIGSTNTGAPYLTLISTATAGTAGVGSGGTGANGAAGAASAGTAIAGGGGGGGGGTASNSGLVATAGAGGVGGPGGSGSGGGAAARYFTTTATITGTAGNGGNAVANSGGGGGGGGALNISGASAAWTASSITAQSSKGGNGGSGLLTVIYVA